MLTAPNPVRSSLRSNPRGLETDRGYRGTRELGLGPELGKAPLGQRGLCTGPGRPRLLRAGAALLIGLLAGCDDPTCIFSPGGCFDHGNTPSLGAFASLPPEGAVLRSGRPEILAVAPGGANVAPTTPLVIYFSESMSGATLADAFELTRISAFGALPVPFSAVQLGEGRLWALLPVQPLTAGDQVELVYVGGDEPARDLTGEALDALSESAVLSFTVAATAPVIPELIATWPLDASDGQSQTGEILAIFDRPMDAATFLPTSFVVQVDGVPPPVVATPSPVTVGAGGFSVPDRRLWRWLATDTNGDPVPFGAEALVSVSLSPAGAKLESEAGEELAAETFDFTTGALLAPSGAQVLSSPADAIGLANLESGGDQELRLNVEFPAALAGDRLVLHLFGTELGEEPDFVALRREVTLSGTGTLTSTELDLAAIGLLTDAGRPEPVLADDDLYFVFSLERGNQASPARLIDLDSSTDGVQTVVLDTEVPTLLELGPTALADLETGEGLVFRSDARRIALWGRASETLRALEIDSAEFNTADQAPVQGSDAQGRFLSAGLDIGRLLPEQQGTELTFRLYDRAFNPSPEVYTAALRQLGGMGPDLLAPGGTSQEIEVEVYDRSTLLPIQGALVISHAEESDLSTYTLLGSEATGAEGRAQVPSHINTQAGTLITVVAAGYDIFTLHGTAVARLSIPLNRILPQTSVLLGSVGAESDFAKLSLPLSDLAVHDARIPALEKRLDGADACSSLPSIGPACPFGPIAIASARPGAASVFAGAFDLPFSSFSPALFLTGYDTAIGTGSLAPAGAQTLSLSIEKLLSEPGLPVEELPVSATNAGLSGGLTTGLDFGNLVDDALIAGAPDVVLDVELAGISGPFVVGLGAAFSVASTDWLLRGVYPGGLTDLILAQGPLEDALHYGVELRDQSGALSGTRLTLAQLGDLSNTVFAANVPSVVAPQAAATVGGDGFSVLCENSLVDLAFALSDPGTVLGSGLYRARLTDSAGRSWEVYRSDLDEDLIPQVPLTAPTLPAGAGTGLAAGAGVLRVESSAWQAYRPTEFLWSEFTGRRQYYGRTAPTAVVID
jgi:hypothetical protein